MPRSKEPAHEGRRSYLVGSVDSALRLLAALRDHPSLAVKESAELLGVAPSTAHRLLSTLQANGFVAQDPTTRRYGPGPALLGVALASLRRVDVRRVARPHLAALSAETRETANLGVPEGAMVRIIDSVEGPEVVRVSARTGEVVPSHLAAAGKVLLAALSDGELFHLLPADRLPGRSGSPSIDRADLIRELAEVRRQGHATSDEETSPGLASVGVGIRDARGRMLAALSVSLPVERFDAARAETIAAATHHRAARIEEELRSPALRGISG
ncbi:MAG: IclR family transcriptional regulator [Acidimicrobiales bacterium]